LINIFKKNNIFTLLYLIVFLVLIRLTPFFYKIPIVFDAKAPLAQLLFSWLSSLNNYYYISIISASLLVLLQAWLVNYFVSKHAIISTHTYLPAFFFIIFNSIYAEQLLLSPQLISNLFFVLMFGRLCNLYQSEKGLYIVLDASFYLGLAVLFNYDALVFLPFILLSVLIVTSFSLRFILITIFGVIMPVYFLGVVFYLTDHLNNLLIIFQNSLNRTYIDSISINWTKVIPWILITLLVLISSFKLQADYFKNTVKNRRILLIIMLFVLFACILLLIDNNNIIYSLSYLTIPFSMVISYFFISKKLKLVKEIAVFLLISLAIFFQFIIYLI
jgi:hypothetical protein